MKKFRTTATALIACSALTLAACSASGEDTATDESNSSTAAPAEIHSLADSVTIGDEVLISELKLSDDGCEFQEEPKKDVVKFQLLATVENKTEDTIKEVLWPSDISFEDADGFTLNSDDLAPAEPACASDEPQEFNNMKAGEKRRAAVTLVAPAEAVSMTYSTDLIKGANPVTWDIQDALKDLVSNNTESEESSSADDATAPTSAAPTSEANSDSSQNAPVQTPASPEPAPAQPAQPAPPADAPVMGFTEAPGIVEPTPMEKTIASCGGENHERGTTFFTDGTSGWTAHCAAQMG